MSCVRWSWEAERRSLRDYAVDMFLIDLIAIGVGGFASRHLGAEMWLFGAVVAAWVNVCFAAVIFADLAFQCAAGWWVERDKKRGRG